MKQLIDLLRQLGDVLPDEGAARSARGRRLPPSSGA